MHKAVKYLGVLFLAGVVAFAPTSVMAGSIDEAGPDGALQDSLTMEQSAAETAAQDNLAVVPAADESSEAAADGQDSGQAATAEPQSITYKEAPAKSDAANKNCGNTAADQSAANKNGDTSTCVKTRPATSGNSCAKDNTSTKAASNCATTDTSCAKTNNNCAKTDKTYVKITNNCAKTDSNSAKTNNSCAKANTSCAKAAGNTGNCANGNATCGAGKSCANSGGNCATTGKSCATAASGNCGKSNCVNQDCAGVCGSGNCGQGSCGAAKNVATAAEGDDCSGGSCAQFANAQDLYSLIFAVLANAGNTCAAPNSDLLAAIQHNLWRYFQSENISLADVGQVTTTSGQANAAAKATAADYQLDDAYAAEVIRLVNIERVNAGLDELAADQSLCEAAAIRATEIQTNFSHTRPDGSSCFTALSEVSASYTSAGENIAIGQGSPEEVVKAWMNSPGHRANILNSSFSRIGVASLANSSGNFSGYAWAQFFAN